MMTTAYQGARVRRIEDHPLLQGRGTFVDNLRPPGVWYVAVVRSPHAHARIRRIRGAGRRSSVLITKEDFHRQIYLPGEIEEGPFARHPMLAGDRVCYVGQPVAAVLGRTPAEALDRAESVDVDYDPLPAVTDPERAMAPGAIIIHPKLRTNVAYREGWKRGRSARAANDAGVSITQRIVHQRVAPITVEGRAVLAVPPSGSDRTLTVWSSTQMPHGLRDELVALAPRSATVRVVAPDVGGGFGAKGTIYPEEFLVPLLAMRTGRPLKWVESRREHLMTTCHGRGQFADVTLRASRDGRIHALSLRVVVDVGAYLMSTTAFVPSLTLEMATGPYDIHSADVEMVEAYTNKVPTGAYRGAGRPEATYYLERTMDLLAADLGLDPAEIRRRNFIPPDQFPYRAPSGTVYDSGNYPAALDRALESSGYAGWRQQQAEGREQHRYIGIGLSSYVESCTYGRDTARTVLDGSGRITVYSGTSPHGQGGATGFAQIVADALGVDITQVMVVTGDTALIPEGDGTAGSRTLVVGGSAVYRAAQTLRRKVLERAARRLEAAREDLVLAQGRISIAGVPARSIALAEVVGGRTLSASGRFTVGESTCPFGTHVAIVEVDPDTGSVAVLQHVAVDDCGVVINPLLVAGQIHGGVAQALGQALYEEATYDRHGQVLAGSLADYAIPKATMMPPVVTLRTETPSPLNPLGAKGVGEAGTIGATPAITNAVIDALAPFGVRHLDMPLLPKKIWAAIHRPSPAE